MRANRLRMRKQAQLQSQKVIEEPKKVEHMEEEDDDVSQEEIEVSKSQQREQMKSQLAPQTKDSMKMSYDLSLIIAERYKDLLRELATQDDSLEELNLSREEKDLINKKVELWLEYFISTATFRDDDINLFDYLTSFCRTQKFL